MKITKTKTETKINKAKKTFLKNKTKKKPIEMTKINNKTTLY